MDEVPGWPDRGSEEERALRRKLEESRAERAARVADADFPVYGLPETWTGLRVLAGAAWRTSLPLVRAELVHVKAPGGFYDLDRSTARLTTISEIQAPRLREDRPATDPSDALSHGLARELRSALDLPPFPEEAEQAERLAWLREPERALAAAGAFTRGERSLPVDGTLVTFQTLTSGSSWAAGAVLGSYDHTSSGALRPYLRTLRLLGQAWPIDEMVALGLQHVQDWSPYINDRRH